jgi:hypothetical protein
VVVRPSGPRSPGCAERPSLALLLQYIHLTYKT